MVGELGPDSSHRGCLLGHDLELARVLEVAARVAATPVAEGIVTAVVALFEQVVLEPRHPLRVEVALELGSETELAEHEAACCAIELGIRQVGDPQQGAHSWQASAMRRALDPPIIRLAVGAQVGAVVLCLVSVTACISAPSPAQATPPPSAPATPTTGPSGTWAPTASSTAGVSATPVATPSATPTPDTSGVATRIVISTLKIDLPVIRLPVSGIHYCGVALWWAYPGFVAPGQVGSVYLLAHSRAGMFLPLLDASLVNNGRALLGLKIQVYTSADWVFTYTIVRVRRHVSSSGTTRLSAPLAATDAELWLQTSEGPSTASPYLQVASRLLDGAATTHSVANPIPRPYLC